MTRRSTGAGGIARRSLVLLPALLLAAGAAAQQPVRVVAAGDIACDPASPSFNGGLGTATGCRMLATSDLALALGADAVLALGDTQYESGTPAAFQASYDPTWGRLKAITHPAVGNHEYLTAGAAGYFGYFGAAAGDPQEGWYSFDLGGWHVVALNSNCGAIGGCGPGSAQHDWLLADLAANPAACTLAYWHHPRFSSGAHGNDPTVAPLWEALHDAGADLVLAGHDHLYERFAPQDASGAADPTGPRQITVGTGGKNLVGVAQVRPNSAARRVAFGVLALDLYADGYAWSFATLDGAPGDSGIARCPGAPEPPAAAFHTVRPGRVADTRAPAGPGGAPALAAGAPRIFPVAGACGIPADAVAVALNVTAVTPGGHGHLTVYPAGFEPPATSVLNFRTGRTRAGSMVARLGVGGQVEVGAVLLDPGGAGAVHVVLDVTGYFR